jgi:hypothetical protein
MLVWVLEANPAARFYEGLGAVRVGAKEIEIGGVPILVGGNMTRRRVERRTGV